MESAETILNSFAGKRVLFITTKNIDYIRNSQEINAIRNVASDVIVIGDTSSSYPKRLARVYAQLMKQSMDGIDVAFVGFAPQLIMPFFYRKLRRAQLLVIDFFISVYDTMVLDRKKFGQSSPMAAFCHRLDRRTLDRADVVICDTMAHGQFFADEFSMGADKLRVLYLQADTSLYYPRHVLRQDGKHRVVYFGSILPLQGVDVILQALTSFAGMDDYQFEIIGPIGDHLVKPVQNNITYINWLSQADLADHLAQADLALAGHFNGHIDKAARTIPGKAYIYEAMGLPMILGDGPANHELYSPDDRHIFTAMGDSDGLAQAIRDYFEK